MQRLVRGGGAIEGKQTWHLKIPPPTVLTFLLASVEGSQQKVVKKEMSQICQKLIKHCGGAVV